MAVLTSKTQAGGVVGDTYTDASGAYEIVHVFPDGTYGWNLTDDSYTDGIRSETLTVTGQNTINPLSQIPTGTVQFLVNGVAVDGITNTGAAVNVNAAALGYNVGTTDIVKATY